MSLTGVGGLIILAAAIVIGGWRSKRSSNRVIRQPMVYRTIAGDGSTEDFDFTALPSTARITARGEALAFTLTRQHMAGPGSAWFEPTSPLVFELDSGDVHVIPRRLIASVEPFESDDPHQADEQTLMIKLRPGAGVNAVAISAKTEAVSAWAELSTAEG